MSKFSISCNTQSSKFTVTVDSQYIWNSETQNQTTQHKSTKTFLKLKVNLLKTKWKAILYTIQENDWFWSIISLMAILQKIYNHHWNEIRWNELHTFYLNFTEELQPNSQGCKESNLLLSHTIVADQGRKVSFNENFSTYVLLITFIEKQPYVELITN